jgi:hypothetical protein
VSAGSGAAGAWPSRRWAGGLGALALVGIGVAPGVPAAEDPPPVIVTVSIPPRLVAGVPLDFVVVYRAPRANLVAVDQTVEDLDGPLFRRTTRQRRIGVIAQAFGYQAGELRIPVAFAGAGRRRLTVVLVTDDGVESDPRSIEVDIGR